MGDGSRKAMRQQRRNARRAKRQAKRLSKIYGDMSPDDISAINDTAPDLGGAAAQVGPGGTQPSYSGDDGGDDGSLYGDDSDFLEYLERNDDPISIMNRYNKAFGTTSAAFESWDAAEAAEDGFGADALIGDVGNIVSQFRKNWEANKPEGYERPENFFGIGKFFKSIGEKPKEGMENAENLNDFEIGAIKDFIPVIIMAVVAYYLTTMGGYYKYAGYAVAAFAVITAIKTHKSEEEAAAAAKKK